MNKCSRNATLAFLFLSTIAASTDAQTTAAPSPGPPPFGILDNSFLVEEAFNQEAGVFQNIFGVLRVNDVWVASFTQEWPVKTQTHQFSYTLSFLHAFEGTGVGDTLINYRYQALTEGPGRPAFSPRASLVLPTGRVKRGLGNGSAGLQINLPFSKRFRDSYWHWNGGMTWLPRAEVPDDPHRHQSVTSPFLSGSGIFRVRQMLNVMVESVLLFEQSASAGSAVRETLFTLSPGARGGWNIGDKQVVVGAAVPVTWGGGDTDAGLFLYFSYELPFKR